MIDYAKYANMSRKQLVNSLDSVEKRAVKYRAEAEAKIKDMQDLALFLQTKIKESFAKSKYEFKTLEEWGLDKVAEEVKKQIPLEKQEQLRKEMLEEVYRKDNDNEL